MNGFFARHVSSGQEVCSTSVVLRQDDHLKLVEFEDSSAASPFVSTSLHLYLLAPPRWVPAPLPPSPVSLVRGCAPHITVVLTWFEELKQRVPTGR